jgi:hypothetical protein
MKSNPGFPSSLKQNEIKSKVWQEQAAGPKNESHVGSGRGKKIEAYHVVQHSNMIFGVLDRVVGVDRHCGTFLALLPHRQCSIQCVYSV